MSDTVAVMKDGVIQQIGKPEDVYNEPVNAFVADFIGQSNIVPGVMVKDFLVDFGGARFVCVDKGFGENVPVEVVIRPEDLKIVPPENAKMVGVVESAIFMGVHYEMRIASGEAQWIVHSTMYEPPGNEVGLNLLPMDIHIMHKSENGNGSGNGGKNEK
jgi:spermidine/putrescine transport system ATP-binding protein